MQVSSMIKLCLCVCISMSVWLHVSLGLPPQHLGWLRLWKEGEGCRECNQHLCPPLPNNCPAGRVRDECGCCEQCANVEGQQCDPDGAQKFYGRCGEGLICQRKMPKRGHRAEPEPTCVCQDKNPVCGSDGWTYPNVCQMREAASRHNITLGRIGTGPCHSAPRVLRGPRNLFNYTGNDIVFGCEVSAYPLPNLGWKKTGIENFLPGDDPHISVQARGGPQRYTVSTWLQIQGLHLSDAGVYSCISHNALGETSASAQLTVLRQVVKVMKGHAEEEQERSDHLEEGNADGQLASGDYPGFI
ncbi:kazal-type serine protease inhibitor domain-containing protein 1-like [Epinephelus fuscoguttatus]|uniref:kazal-type serine protease inhibitor domain-containing protein 1-like n=1 Tax=Epinephelus fuscoguttatus TaxID=293821 RepID=UPI0020D16A03|nr:kazal-type serine protease inhibitor domain-containing protein 1-like [Epinephelus fuscoguttatus]